MPKIEITVTEAEKDMIRHAAEKEKLRPATWAKAKLLVMAQGSASGQRAFTEKEKVEMIAALNGTASYFDKKIVRKGNRQ